MIRTDNAGEWAVDAAVWSAMVQRVGCLEMIYTTPGLHKEAADAERSCGIVETVTKCLLMEKNLPPDWWQRCAGAAEFLLNRFPTTRQDRNIPIDGDRSRPIEEMSGGAHSRRQCDRELTYFRQPGELALVHLPKVKGSQLQAKARFAVCSGMYREQPIWWCPWTKSKFRSKDFTAVKLRDGLNFAQFLRLPDMPTTLMSKDLNGDQNAAVTVHLKPYEHALPPQQPIITATIPSTALDSRQYNHIEAVSHPELGGSIRIVDDASGEQLDIDPATGIFEMPTEATVPETAAQPIQQPNTIANPPEIHPPDTDISSDIRRWDDVLVDLEPSAEMEDAWQRYDQEKALKQAYRANGRETLRTIMRNKVQLEPVYHDIYVKWLKNSDLTKKYYQDVNVRIDRTYKPKPKSPFPLPSGALWKALKAEEDKKRNAKNADHINSRLVKHLMMASEIEVKTSKELTAFVLTHHEEPADRQVHAHAAKRRKTKAQDVMNPPPTTFGLAIQDPKDGKDWSAEGFKEYDGITDLGVFDHGPDGRGYTKAELQQLGITARPVATKAICDNKRGPNSEIIRHKVRIVVLGHPGNMFKGIHYSETFAAAPVQDSSRILMALATHFQLKQKSWDISQAYLWAPLPPGELIALRYPDGFRKYHNGEETFIVMRKNLYGHPAAARAWSKTRDEFIMRHFNEHGWTCHQARGDPCLFYIMKGDQYAWMLIHTDDCDAVGSSDEILKEIMKAMDTEWKVKEVTSEYILGVTRKQVTETDGTFDIECTMAQYCDAMHEAFKEHLNKRRVETPFPPDLMLSLEDEVPEEETQAVIERGYQRGVGMCLWAARGVFPECMYATSQLCKIMSKPSEAGWSALMHTMKYMIQHKNFGIKFSHRGNDVPLVYVDSSFKDDKHDGKCQYGYEIQWKGGPIRAQSRKFKHVAHAASHAEYMAMCEASKSIIWLRQLFKEIGLPDLVSEPTLLMGDNDTALKLANDDKPTQGNQYIRTAYHFCKEVVEEGDVVTASIDTKENPSDIQTKAVGSDVMDRLAAKQKGYEPDWQPTIRHTDKQQVQQQPKKAETTKTGAAAAEQSC